MSKMTSKTDRVTRLMKKPAPYKTKMQQTKKQAYSCIDGPLKGSTLWLTSACTGVMKIGDTAFRYISADKEKPYLKAEFQ